MFVRPKCVHGSECTRAWVSVSVSCSDNFACALAWGTPLLIPTPSFARRESFLWCREVREARVPTPLRPHHSPDATCVAAPAPARLRLLLLLQRGHLLAADSPAFKPAPGSGRPPGPAWWSGAGPLRPRPRPKEGSGLPRTPSTADPEPSPAVARRWPEAALWLHNLLE